jgi:hypothetical protein
MYLFAVDLTSRLLAVGPPPGDKGNHTVLVISLVVIALLFITIGVYAVIKRNK